MATKPTIKKEQKNKPTRLNLSAKVLAHDCPTWCLTWLPDHNQDILFTGGADGTIKKWNISGTANKYASLFDDMNDNDNDNDIKMNGDDESESRIKLELTNTGTKSIGITPITDIKCVPVASAPNTYLLTTVSVDSFVRVYAINTNDYDHDHDYDYDYDHDEDNENSAGIDEYKHYDMNERHRVYVCDQNGKKSHGHAQYLEQYGGCWSSDINTDCSVMATGDQFGQVYLWPLYDNNDNNENENENKNKNKNKNNKNNNKATVLQALVPMVKLHNNKDAQATKTLRGAHAMVGSVTFNRRMNPNWLAVSCQSAQRVEVFDIEKCVSIFNRKLTYKEIRDCRWYCGGAEAYLCVACDDSFVHVYDAGQNKKNSKKALIASLASHKSCVTSVDFGRKQYVASASMDNTVKLWDLHQQNDNKLIETHHDHDDQVWKVRFNTKNDKLATVGDDGYLCLYTMKY